MLESTYSEYLYGLKRVRVDGLPFVLKDRFVSILNVVIVPYIKDKLDEKFKDFKEASETVDEISLIK